MTKTKLLKIALSIILLGWLLAQVDYGSLRSYLVGAEYWWYFVAIATLPVTVWCGLRKWQILMASRGLAIEGRLLYRYFLVGHFFGNFFPSNVGGDIVRASLVTRHAGRQYWTIATGSVLVERLTGLVGLFVVLVVGALLHYDWFVSLNIVYPVLFAILGFVAAMLFVFSDIGSGLLSVVGRVPFLNKPVGLVRKLHDLMLEYRNDKAELIECVVISVFFYLINALQLWLLLRMFPPVTVEWTTQLVTFTVTSLIAMIPISFNGYGIQEGGYTFLLGSLGYTFTGALAIALLFRGLSIVLSIVGGIIFATSDLSRRAIEKSVAELPTATSKASET